MSASDDSDNTGGQRKEEVQKETRQFLTRMKNVRLLISVGPSRMVQKMWFDFLCHLKRDKCQTLPDDTINWALIIYTTFTDRAYTSTSRSQIVIENFMFWTD